MARIVSCLLLAATLSTSAWCQDFPLTVIPSWLSISWQATYGTALGDINNDGFLDLVCGNFRGGNTLFLNDNGSLPETPDWTSEDQNTTKAVALGDIDGDGDLDLVCGNDGVPNTLYRNMGGVFETTPSWSSNASYQTRDVALGDMDGDGDLDLVCGNFGDKNTVYLNHAGSFELAASWESSEANLTEAVALGDVNGDETIDLVCGNQGRNTLYLNFAGVLANVWSSTPTHFTRSVALGDVDGDGDFDLVCGNAGAENVLYLNIGGLFVFEQDPGWQSGPLNPTSGVELGDMDGDGDLDLVCSNLGEANTLYLNVGGLLELNPLWSSASEDVSRAVCLGDIDNDGDLDVMCGVSASSSLGAPNTQFTNESFRFSSAPSLVFNTIGPCVDMALGDVDGDADPDVACAHLGEFDVNALYRNDLNNDALFPMIWQSALEGENPRGVALGDITGDGLVDAVFADGGYIGDPGTSERDTMYRNVGGTFEDLPFWSHDLGLSGSLSATLGDVDGDGDLDLVVGRNIETALYLNNGGTLEDSPAWRGGNAQDVILGDIDRDGDLDLVSSAGVDGNTLHENIGGVFSEQPVWSSNPRGNTTSIALGDVNGDGYLDLVCGNGDQANTLYLNTGGAFSSVPRWFSSLKNTTTAVSLGDVDQDGDVDLVCGNRASGFGVSARNTVYLNIGGTFQRQPAWSFAQEDSTYSSALADLDTDGDLDIVFGNSGRPNAVFLNTALPPYTGDPPSPKNHCPNNPAFLEMVSVERGPTSNRVSFAAVDVESDPILVVAEYKFKGQKQGFAIDILGQSDHRILVASSPTGVQHEFEWGTLQFPPDERDVILILRAISHPARAGLIRHVASHIVQVGPVEPARPQIVVDCEEVLLLPTTTAGDSSVTEFRISNSGSTPLLLQPFDLPPADLAITPATPLAVAPRDSRVFTVHSPGARALDVSSWMRVNSNDPISPQVEIPIRAKVRALDFSVVNPYPTGEIRQGDDLPVPVTMVDSVASDSAKVFYRWTGESDFREAPLTFIADPPRDQYTTVIPGSSIPPRGIEFYVTVYNGTAQSSSDLRRLTMKVQDLSFPDPQPAGRFRMVSVPLALSGTALGVLNDDLGSLDPTRWRMFGYDATEARYAKLTNEDPFALEQGRSYWLISREQAELDVQPSSGVTAASNESFEIVLEPRWNMISNPFNFPVAWASVQTSVVFEERPIGFDPSLGTVGGYSTEDVTVLQPFEGYFLNNPAAQPETLWVPPVEWTAPAPQPTKLSVAPDSWQIRLVATSDAAQDNATIFGVHPQAADGHDALDRRKPPSPPGSWVRASFVNRNWGNRSGAYRRDVRSADTEGHTWNLEITSSHAGEEIVLGGWTEVDLPSATVVRLVDVEQGVSIDLVGTEAAQSTYALLSRGPQQAYRLTILVGTRGYVDDHSQALVALPSAVILEQNAPNPFNPATRIRFGLPTPARVSLAIFDVRGARVARLLSAEQFPAGYHSVIWDGTTSAGARVASGVYLYRLDAGKVTRTSKMLVAR